VCLSVCVFACIYIRRYVYKGLGIDANRNREKKRPIGAQQQTSSHWRWTGHPSVTARSVNDCGRHALTVDPQTLTRPRFLAIRKRSTVSLCNATTHTYTFWMYRPRVPLGIGLTRPNGRRLQGWNVPSRPPVFCRPHPQRIRTTQHIHTQTPVGPLDTSYHVVVVVSSRGRGCEP
jgi:hypothetical protein